MKWRRALVVLVAASWLITVPLMWRAFSTLPSAERLERSHMVQIPTLQTLLLQVGISFLEMAVVVAVLWPGYARAWLLRLWFAALGTTFYFLLTPPLGLTTLQWVHRRWLAALSAGLLITALTASMLALGQRLRRAR